MDETGKEREGRVTNRKGDGYRTCGEAEAGTRKRKRKEKNTNVESNVYGACLCIAEGLKCFFFSVSKSVCFV